ncbi:2-alkenal reductase (NADP(+)-dependent) isoform X3 [Eucalyptus grandis]|uniref:2-alkenal reductase (NADP(+)-dependent) isoform X3 n=1 Tax=Eucalyptus grandis TaxID=71139 RepID=UPI00192F0D7D|nr:2-alkenal reductase (NADP(+)-dependent) isoform X3 [Eucalyptus grandis]
MEKRGAMVSNKQMALSDYVSCYPTVDDMEVRREEMKLEVPRGSKAVVVKNLYLSCDTYMRLLRNRTADELLKPYTPGSVSSLVHLYAHPIHRAHRMAWIPVMLT